MVWPLSDFTHIIQLTEKNNSFVYVRNDEDPKNIQFLIIPPGVYEISEMGKAMLTFLKKIPKKKDKDYFHQKLTIIR